MGSLVIKCLQDMCERGFDLRLCCGRCGRAVALERYTLRHWCKALHWSQEFEAIARRFPCRHCGGWRFDWGFIQAGHNLPLIDLSGVARDRRDGHLAQARFWHDIALQRQSRRRWRYGQGRS